MAMAVDERYTRLAPAVTTHPVFEGELLDEWRIVIVDGDQHMSVHWPVCSPRSRAGRGGVPARHPSHRERFV